MLWVGEYSVSQGAFHIQPLADAVVDYLKRAKAKNSSNDWFPVAIGEEDAVRQDLKKLGCAPARLLPVIPCKQDRVNLIPLIPCPYCGGKHGHGAGPGPWPRPPWWAGHRVADCHQSNRGYYLFVVEAKHTKKNRAFIIG